METLLPDDEEEGGTEEQEELRRKIVRDEYRNDEPLEPTNPEEVISTIAKMGKKKAPGPDGMKVKERTLSRLISSLGNKRKGLRQLALLGQDGKRWLFGSPLVTIGLKVLAKFRNVAGNDVNRFSELQEKLGVELSEMIELAKQALHEKPYTKQEYSLITLD
uniref:Uncharacterized protein n=1 Tax=Timema bartmani TaxID=61472 RepID=A0A7R9EX71_9NEOP|nr:unnamed protein product [Timema bartmani]